MRRTGPPPSSGIAAAAPSPGAFRTPVSGFGRGICSVTPTAVRRPLRGASASSGFPSPRRTERSANLVVRTMAEMQAAMVAIANARCRLTWMPWWVRMRVQNEVFELRLGEEGG